MALIYIPSRAAAKKVLRALPGLIPHSLSIKNGLEGCFFLCVCEVLWPDSDVLQFLLERF